LYCPVLPYTVLYPLADLKEILVSECTVYVGIYQYIPVYAGIYQHVPAHTIRYFVVLPCPALYRVVSTCGFQRNPCV
jgi:hypothetical protein